MGRKLQTYNADTTVVYDYLGSLTVIDNNGATTVEAGFGDGLIRGGAVVFHEKDHLGSIRVSMNSVGAIAGRNDYWPFGTRIGSATTPIDPNNRHFFNGKEGQTLISNTLLDYGARLYDSDIPTWLSPDPLAEKYYSMSPYAFSGNNPVRYVDPNGMEIEDASMDEWLRQQNAIQGSMDRLQQRMDRMVDRGGNAGTIANLGERISGMSSTLNTMSQLASSSQMYALGAVTPGNLPGPSYNQGTGVITITYGSTANFVHEVTHAGQFETGDMGFFNSGETAAQDVYDEVTAYSAQYLYDPASVTGIQSSSSIRSLVDINAAWVQGIVYNGVRIYNPGTMVNTGLYPVNVNSTKADLMRAWPGTNFPGFSNTIPFRNMYPIHYKR